MVSLFQNTSSELNHTTDGFINSILYDDDLLMDGLGVNVNNDGTYILFLHLFNFHFVQIAIFQLMAHLSNECKQFGSILK